MGVETKLAVFNLQLGADLRDERETKRPPIFTLILDQKN